MELKMGAKKGRTVEAVMREPDGIKFLEGHLSFVEKSFGDPKWGEHSRKYYDGIKAEMARVSAVAQTSTAAQPNVQTGARPSAIPEQLRLQLEVIGRGLVSVEKALKANHEEVMKALTAQKVVQPVIDAAALWDTTPVPPEQTPADIAWEE